MKGSAMKQHQLWTRLVTQLIRLFRSRLLVKMYLLQEQVLSVAWLLLYAVFAGARYIVVSDLSDSRLEIAKKMGATRTINPSKGEKVKETMDSLGIVGFDIGLEMSGSPKAFEEMIDNMYNGSKIALLGILPNETKVEWDKIIFKALQIKGIYGREMFETWYKMEQMLISGLDLSPVITHRFPVDDFQKGFDVMERRDSGKVILAW